MCMCSVGVLYVSARHCCGVGRSTYGQSVDCCSCLGLVGGHEITRGSDSGTIEATSMQSRGVD